MADPAPSHRLLVNPERIRANLRTFARIGYSPDGGINRLAFSRSDLRARQTLVHLLASLGLRTTIDGIGNVFGRLPGGDDPRLPPILVGSHLDTVPGGGRFDGSLGVVAAVEVAAVLREHAATTRHPVEVVSFSCEESSRFGRSTLGSGVVAGVWDAAEILELTDVRGVRLGQVLQRLGLDPNRVASARRQPGDFAAYVELHIEQGRVLEEARAPLGIVEAIAAPTRLRVRLTGRADHSGATPMTLRRDALAGAAEVVLAVERIARSIPGVVGTVGTLAIEPGAINVVPGRADLAIDVRGTVSADKRHAVDEIQEAIAAIAAARGLTASRDVMSDEEPVRLDPRVVDTLERLARERGIPATRLASGAGHDAMQMARLCPTGMLMVPSRGGISHNRAEWSELDDIVTGIQVLLDATLALAQPAGPG